MSQEEEKVLKDIKMKLKVWLFEAKALQLLLTILGVIGIICSIFIAAYAGTELISPKWVKLSAFVATVCLTLISAFNLLTKTSNYITAWRIVSAAVYCYEAGISDISFLIKSYEDGEKMLGSVNFQYSKTQVSTEN